MDMRDYVQLLGLLLLWLQGARCDIQMTQIPTSLPISVEDTVTITCKANEDIGYLLYWFQQKPGKVPKWLIYAANSLKSGVPLRFSGSESGVDYTLTINSLEPEDVVNYYCLQGYDTPPVVIQAIIKPPGKAEV